MGQKCEKRKIFIWGLTGVNYMYIFWDVSCELFTATCVMGHPLICTLTLVCMSAGVSRGHNLQTESDCLDSFKTYRIFSYMDPPGLGGWGCLLGCGCV